MKEQTVDLMAYEKAAIWAFDKLKLNWESANFDKEMEEVDIFIRFKHAANLSLLIAFLTLPLSTFIFVFGKSSMTNWVALLLPFLFAFICSYIPLYIAKLRKLKILGQAPLSLLYLVIAMEVTPNLESSVAFAAKNMPDPMGRIFKHLLWLVETRKIPDMEQALTWYSTKIREWAPHVAESLYLIAGSMREGGDMRTRTLNKSVTTVLDGTKKIMEDFARSLDLPVMATNAFGIMLPVLMLVMLPIVSVFSNAMNVGPAMLLIYDFILPLSLGTIIIYILGQRPGSLSEIKYKKTRYKVKMFGKTFNALPLMILTGSIFLTLQITIIILNPSVLSATVMGDTAHASTMTMPIILALGIPFGLFFMSWAQENQEIKKRVSNLEREFASALYQLGNVMSQGIPLEQAMEDVSKRMKGSETETFFMTATSRMKTIGWPLEKILFDEKNGLMNSFPSNLIRNIMMVIFKSADKGPKSASMTAISVSKYLKVMDDVKNKIDDLLAESTSSIKFQGMLLIPIITGTIVGLGEITSNLLVQIGKQITSITQMGAASGTGFVSDLLNVQGAIQPSYLQLIVGIYVVLTCIVLGVFVGGLQEGWDKMTMFLNIGQITLWGSITYVATAAFVALVFGGLSQAVM